MSHFCRDSLTACCAVHHCLHQKTSWRPHSCTDGSRGSTQWLQHQWPSLPQQPTKTLWSSCLLMMFRKCFWKSSGSEHLSAVISVSEASASFSLISPETTESIPVLKSIHLPGICTLKFQLMSTCWKSLLCLRDDSDVSPEVRTREFSTKSERCVQDELLICSLVSVCDQYLDLSVKTFTLKFKCLQYNIYLYIIDH